MTRANKNDHTHTHTQGDDDTCTHIGARTYTQRDDDMHSHTRVMTQVHKGVTMYTTKVTTYIEVITQTQAHTNMIDTDTEVTHILTNMIETQK